MSEAPEPHVLVLLTVGKSDNGKSATMAFSCALSAVAMGRPATVFLTSDGSVWGYKGSADETRTQGFPELSDLIGQYLDAGGDVIICSVCHKTCSSGNPESNPTIEMLPGVTIGGWATIIERGVGGMTVTF